MFEIVVVSIPRLHLPLQVTHGSEDIHLVEFFLILAMAPLHRAVLCGLPWIDEVMDNVSFVAEMIKGMNAFRHSIQSFVCARVAVGEDGSVVGLHRLDPMRKPTNDLFEKKACVPSALLIEHFEVAPA